MNKEEPFDENGMMEVSREEFEIMAAAMMKFWVGITSVVWFIVLLLTIIVLLVV